MELGRFRDRKIAASLKPELHVEADGVSGRFRDRKIAASLKQPSADQGPLAPRRFRDRKIAASLKRAFDVVAGVTDQGVSAIERSRPH